MHNLCGKIRAYEKEKSKKQDQKVPEAVDHPAKVVQIIKWYSEADPERKEMVEREVDQMEKDYQALYPEMPIKDVKQRRVLWYNKTRKNLWEALSKKEQKKQWAIKEKEKEQTPVER